MSISKDKNENKIMVKKIDARCCGNCKHAGLFYDGCADCEKLFDVWQDTEEYILDLDNETKTNTLIERDNICELWEKKDKDSFRQKFMDGLKKYEMKTGGRRIPPKCTCDGCKNEKTCPYAWDIYNTDGDCLANWKIV